MTIILFLVDTSGSMNQRTYNGPTLLDLAKGAVDTFLKFRARDPAARAVDRYMLLTFEEPPRHIKAGWKESQTTFMEELKNLKATSHSTLGPALGNALHLLNVNRLLSGVDNFGIGRYPSYLEPAVILLITDGGPMTCGYDTIRELEVPKSALPGSELVDEPFRWDQRLFALVLRIPGHYPKTLPTNSIIPSDTSPIDAMCEVTGGRSYCISSTRMLSQSLESLVQKVQSGVVVYFEKFGPDPPSPAEGAAEKNLLQESAGGAQSTRKPAAVSSDSRPSSPSPLEPAWYKTRKMIYVPRTASRGYVLSHWPIPEAFRPDISLHPLPARTAQPHIRFRCSPCEPLVLPDMPFDKYELEPSPLTQFILEMKQPSVCWQVFLRISGDVSETGAAFGYLKASSSLSCVNLFVMPYNYPVLFPLLEELRKNLNSKPTQSWRVKFDQYLKSLPMYYFQPLKKVLIRLGLGRAMPDACENFLSYTALSYLNKVKQLAQEEMTKICQSVTQAPPSPEGLRLAPLPRQMFRQLRGNGVVVPSWNARGTAGSHDLPVAEMGNYQDYLKQLQPPLREIEPPPVRQHAFGNPFKVDKRMLVDEADFNLSSPNSMSMPGKSPRKTFVEATTSPARGNFGKRKQGPLPREFHFVPISLRIEEAAPKEEQSHNQEALRPVEGSITGFACDENMQSPVKAPDTKDSQSETKKEFLTEIPDSDINNSSVTGAPVENHEPVHEHFPPETFSLTKQAIMTTVRMIPCSKSEEQTMQHLRETPKTFQEYIVRFAVFEASKFKKRKLCDMITKEYPHVKVYDDCFAWAE